MSFRTELGGEKYIEAAFSRCFGKAEGSIWYSYPAEEAVVVFWLSIMKFALLYPLDEVG